jgi:integrase
LGFFNFVDKLLTNCASLRYHSTRSQKEVYMAKQQSKRRLKKYAIEGVQIREIRPNYYLGDIMRDGIRVRKTFTILAEAEAWAKAKAQELKNHGVAALDIPERVRDELPYVLEKLNNRISLSALADYWLARNPDTTAERWEETAERYIAEMTKGGRRTASVRDKSIKLKVLADVLKNPVTCSVDRQELVRQIAAYGHDKEWSSRTQSAYVGAGLTLVRFYRGEGKRMHKADEVPPKTWDAAFIKKMMHAAENVSPAIVPALAVMTFAGIRPAEATRLTWDAINFKDKLISLTGETTKTRDTRHITMTPNLGKWLLQYKGEGLLIDTPYKFRVGRDNLKEKLEIDEWSNDVLRHTCATQMYARTNDIDKTCAELGHYEKNTFLKHYKGMMPKPAEVKLFWGIVPAKAQKENTDK